VRQRPCQRTQRGGIGGDHREQRPRSTVHTRAEPRSPFFSKASDGFGRPLASSAASTSDGVPMSITDSSAASAAFRSDKPSGVAGRSKN
jgi:hypothetical protein